MSPRDRLGLKLLYWGRRLLRLPVVPPDPRGVRERVAVRLLAWGKALVPDMPSGIGSYEDVDEEGHAHNCDCLTCTTHAAMRSYGRCPETVRAVGMGSIRRRWRERDRY